MSDPSASLAHIQRLRIEWRDMRRGLNYAAARDERSAFDALWDAVEEQAAAVGRSATLDDVLLAMLVHQELQLAELRAALHPALPGL